MLTKGEEKYRYWCSKKGSEAVGIGELGINPRTGEAWVLTGFSDDGEPKLGRLVGTDAKSTQMLSALADKAKLGGLEDLVERKRTIGLLVFTTISFPSEFVKDALVPAVGALSPGLTEVM